MPKANKKHLLRYFFGGFIAPNEANDLIERGWMIETTERLEITDKDRKLYALHSDAEYATRHTVTITDAGLALCRESAQDMYEHFVEKLEPIVWRSVHCSMGEGVRDDE